MTKMAPLLPACVCFFALSALASDQSSVRVEPANPDLPRTLEKQTETAAIRDYLQAWQALDKAMEQNRADLLDDDFVGTAKDKLTGTIREQARSEVHTRYQDRAHDIKVLFYSPEGLSIQLIDNVDYDVQVFDNGKLQGTQRVHGRYIAVLSPSEVRWRVRILQSERQ